MTTSSGSPFLTSPPTITTSGFQVGMALKMKLALAGWLWDRWSARSPKYDSSAMFRKWNSFNRSDITIGSVYHLARINGYVAPPTGRRLGPVPSSSSRAMSRPPTEPSRPAPALATPPTLDILNAPGLVGRTMRSILDTSIYPIPYLPMAHAITAVGVTMGHKVQSRPDFDQLLPAGHRGQRRKGPRPQSRREPPSDRATCVPTSRVRPRRVPGS